MKTRVIPVLLLHKGDLVKTVRFRDPVYVGDPINAVRVFNEKEVDEIAIFDIGVTREHGQIDYDLVSDIAAEAFMPISYGGGIRTVEDAERIFDLGFEKIILSSHALLEPEDLPRLVGMFGSSSIVACVDVSGSGRSEWEVRSASGTQSHSVSLESHLEYLSKCGVGEIFVQSIDRDGTRSGFDVDLIQLAAGIVSCPLVALGGAGSVDDLEVAVGAGASAVAAGSLFCFFGPRRAVLINYPSRDELEKQLP